MTEYLLRYGNATCPTAAVTIVGLVSNCRRRDRMSNFGCNRDYGETKEKDQQPDATELLDRALALHAALRYLCSVNAAAEDVRAFLTRHPAALLLDGTGPDTHGSASTVLAERKARCRCAPTGACARNRRALGELLRRVPATAVALESRALGPGSRWLRYEKELVEHERSIRLLCQQRLAIRQFALEASIQVHKYREELRVAEQYLPPRSGRLRLLSCKRNDGYFARRSVLEFQISSACVELSSLERLHEAVVAKIKSARRLQFGVLKQALPYSRCYPCGTDALPTDASQPLFRDRGTAAKKRSGKGGEEYSI